MTSGNGNAPNDPVPRRVEYSIYYFIEFMGIGITAPFLIVYLKRVGFSGMMIGATTAAQRLVGMAAHGFWALMSDTRMGIRNTLLLLIFLSGALMPLFCFTTSYPIIIGLVLLVTFFNGPMIPLADAGIFTHLDNHRDLYGTVRAFGTIGFIITAAGMGKIIAVRNILWLFWCFSAIMAMLFVCAVFVPFSRSTHGQGGGVKQSLGEIQWKRIMPVLVVIFLMNLAARPANGFLSLFIDHMGGKETYIGLAWAIGPLPEIFFFFFSHHLIKRLGLKKILLFGLVLYVIRWVLLALAPNPVTVLLIQPLHGLCFGTTFLAGVRAADMMSGSASRSSAQALVQAVGTSAPSIVGQLVAGWIYDVFNVRYIYWFAAGVTVVALFIATMLVDLDGVAAEPLE